MAMRPARIDREQFVNYRLDEICVLVSGREAIAPEDRYKRVLEELNGAIEEAAGKAGAGGEAPPADALARDLAPSREFQSSLGADRRPLRPITRPRSSNGAGRPARAWVVLPPAPDAEAREIAQLCFYGIGDTPLRLDPDRPPSPAAIRARARRVRDLVNLTFRNRAAVTERFSRLGWRVVSITPHWLTAAAPGEPAICPSPGSKPERAPGGPDGKPGRWRVQFGGEGAERDKVRQLVAEGRAGTGRSPVVVAILDTSPERGAVEAAARRHPENLLLADVCQTAPDGTPWVRIAESPLSREAAYFKELDAYYLNWRDGLQAPRHEQFQMRDHGLFCAGLVRDIAPTCPIHLIRVLSDYGVGDLETLTDTLMRLPDELPLNDDQRLVVNLSLGIAMPPGAQLLRDYLPNTFKDLEGALAQTGKSDLRSALDAVDRGRHPIVTEVVAYLDWLQGCLQRVDDWLAGQQGRMLVVAAAGNDNGFLEGLPPGQAFAARPEPRWPARFDSALGVTALTIGGGRAAYANRGDIATLGNGVATLGGNVRGRSMTTLGEINLGASPVDAVVGIYSSEELTLDPQQNSTASNSQADVKPAGWVYWSGTSFAAPIISALAADYWGRDTRPNAPGIIGQVTGLSAGDDKNPGVQDRLDCLLLPATQAFESA